MTDALRTEGVPLAGPTGVTWPLRELLSRAALVVRDRSVFESASLLVPIVLVGLTNARGPGLWLVCAIYLICMTLLALRTPRSDAASRFGWQVARVLIGVAMVAAGQLLTGGTGILSVAYVPIIALAAFGSPRLVATAVAASIVAQLGVEAIDRASLLEALQRALGFAGAAVLLAYGTRREVVRMQRARDRLRRAVRGDRRRARQIAGVEAVGGILAAQGPTPAALDEVVGRIATEFGYRYVSIYLADGGQARLGAQRGYTDLVEVFDGDRGIVGRVMRTRRPAFAPDVARDPDYWGYHPDVISEICAPMLAEGDFLGFINVESVLEPLDATDLRATVAIADRLAAALTIGRERQRLAERAELFRHLHEFSEAVNGTLEPEELYRAIVRSVSNVVQVDIAALHVLDRESGRHLLTAIESAPGRGLPREVRPGDDVAGRAIRERAMIVDDSVTPALGGHGIGSVFEDPPPMLAAAVPIIRDGAVLGALTVIRRDRAHRFSSLDRDALAMLGEQSALAIANGFLHAEVAELALRDPLTGLFNRRYLDPALEQLFARRARASADERVPLAAIMFDLDHFSELNNRHGHQVGDEVLRVFGSVLKARMRSTDLVARFGGEEFVAILYRADLDDAIRIADQIREQLAATPVPGTSGEELSATVSAGCAAIGPEIESGEDLLRAADVALYMAKRAGRDRVCAA